MALLDEPLLTEITALIKQRHQALTDLLGATLFSLDPPNMPDAASINSASPLDIKLTLLLQIANGEIVRGEASHATVAQVETALTTLHDLLFGTALGPTAPIPSNFWQSDIGLLYSRVRWWLSGDELITISNAAALAFGENSQANRMRIVRAIDNGLLDAIPDPSVANPQQNRRVLRPQVARLGEQRRRPGA